MCIMIRENVTYECLTASTRLRKDIGVFESVGRFIIVFFG